MTQPLWTPSAERCAGAAMTEFMGHIAKVTGREIATYEDLHAFSVREPAKFWSELWTYTGVVGEKGSEPYLVDADKMPGANFFPNARLNYAENALSKRGPQRHSSSGVRTRCVVGCPGTGCAARSGKCRPCSLSWVSVPAIASRPCCQIARKP